MVGLGRAFWGGVAVAGVAAAGVAVTTGVGGSSTPTEDPMVTMSREAAAQVRARHDALAPTSLPPYFQMLSASTQIDEAGRDVPILIFQEGELSGVVCDDASDAAPSCVPGDGNRVIRTETRGDRTVRVMISGLVGVERSKAEEHYLSVAQQAAVVTFWQQVELTRGADPAWLVDLAREPA